MGGAPNKNLKTSAYRIEISNSKVINWISERHWWAISLAALLLIVFVIFDSTHPESVYIFGAEFVVFLVALLIIGLLLDQLMEEIHIHVQTAKIIDYKHKLSLEFSGYYDWNVLINQLAHFPSTLAQVDRTCLFVCDVISKQFTQVSNWSSTGNDGIDQLDTEKCEKFTGSKAINELSFGPCESEIDSSGNLSGSQSYCLPIRYGESLLGMLLFRIAAGESLTNEQYELFKNVGDELGLALKVGLDRKIFLEMRTSETALAERRSVSEYLHDHLGQNLGYLHFKIDQLLSEADRPSLERVFHDLEHMRNAANESYEILRGVLETIHPESTPLFTNLLLEHARKVCLRSNFKLDFKVNGEPIYLPVEHQQAIFYAFEESMSNAEKHAKATEIDVIADWGQDYFALTITDNGIGFDPQTVNTDRHFGLEILNERMAKVSGQITLVTSENSGTIVSIRVPNSPDGHYQV